MRLAGPVLLAAGSLLAACVVSTTAPGPSPRREDPRRSLYRAKCHSCHRLYPADRLSAEKWPPVMEKMASKAKLQDDEKEQILSYLLEGARRPGTAPERK